MRALLRIELQALGNTLRTREGLQAWVGFVIVVGCVAVGAMAISANTLLSDEVVAAIRDHPDAPLGSVFAMALGGSTMLALMLVFATVNKEMFGNSRTDLLLVAPVPRTAIAGIVFVRLVFLAFVLQLATLTPLMLGFVYEAELSGLLLVAFPLGCLALSVPCVAGMMLTQAFVLRFLSGPVLKFCTQVIGAVLLLMCTVLFLLGITADADQAKLLGQQIETADSLAFLLDWPIRLLADAARGEAGMAWFGSLAFLLVPLPILVLVGAMYGRCREMRFVSHRPVVHRLRAPSTDWPATAWASIARKDLVDLTRNRGGILALIVLTCILLVIVYGFAGDDKLSEHSRLPADLQRGFGLLTAWQLLGMIMASIQAMGFAGDEGKNLSLLATSPLAPRELLRGKAFVFLLPFVWTVLVVLVGAPFVVDCSGRALVFFAVAALPLVAVHFAVVAAVSSHPMLFHRNHDVPLAESLTTIGPVLVVMGTMMGLLFGVSEVKSVVTSAHWPEGGYSHWDKTTMWWSLIGGLVAIATVLTWIGVRIAERNLRAVLGPRHN
jgi:uncharacterized membrane protein